MPASQGEARRGSLTWCTVPRTSPVLRPPVVKWTVLVKASEPSRLLLLCEHLLPFTSVLSTHIWPAIFTALLLSFKWREAPGVEQARGFYSSLPTFHIPGCSVSVSRQHSGPGLFLSEAADSSGVFFLMDSALDEMSPRS